MRALDVTGVQADHEEICTQKNSSESAVAVSFRLAVTAEKTGQCNSAAQIGIGGRGGGGRGKEGRREGEGRGQCYQVKWTIRLQWLDLK